jgi:alpha/beta superfamily hydrolase
MIEALTLRTDDGLTLEAEFAAADGTDAGAAVVLCHPHPQFGGTMRSLVTSVLFTDLPAAGYPCLRFNFRGVEGSEGEHSGELEPLDAVAAIESLCERLPAVPIALVGWSFGGDIALGVVDTRVAGWVAIAPPLRVLPSFAAATDPRPKHLVLAEHDEYRAPADIQAEVAGWAATTTAIVPGASHFFVGRTERVVTETRAGLAHITAR